jgi:Zn-dependent peptidase ImmA (M78 family)
VRGCRRLTTTFRTRPQSAFCSAATVVPVIGVNSNQSPVRQRFSAAHECGHYVLPYG